MKTNNLILLHSVTDNSPVTIDARNIIVISKETEFDEYSIDSSERTDATHVIVDSLDEKDCFSVNETCEKLFTMLNTDKYDTVFVKVHFTNSNAIAVMNAEYIDAMYIDDDNDTCINVSDNEINIDNLYINENPEKVYDMIEELIGKSKTSSNE